MKCSNRHTKLNTQTCFSVLIKTTDARKIHGEEQKFAPQETDLFGATCEPKLALQKLDVHLPFSGFRFHVRYRW